MTIKKLQATKWYNLIKISYIFFYVLISLVVILYVTITNLQVKTVVNDETTLIRCTWSNGNTFTAKELRVHFSQAHIIKDETGAWQYNKAEVPTDEILKACEIQKILPEERILQAIRLKIENGVNISTADALAIYINQGWSIDLFSETYDSTSIDKLTALESTIDQKALVTEGDYVAPFHVKFSYSQRGGLKPALIWSAVTLALIILLFEISKKIFYFIITGKIKPERGAKQKKRNTAKPIKKSRSKRS